MYGNIITSVYISKVMKLLFKVFLREDFYFYGFLGLIASYTRNSKSARIFLPEIEAYYSR
jgi:hypothetical protein